jgi:excisionase family DNA binding protein
MADKQESLDKEVFTTYDAARLCNANIASIKNWIGKGLLRAFRTPGGHYRIKRRDLELFIRKFNMPWPFAAANRKSVAMLGGDDKLARGLQAAIPGHVLSAHFEPFSFMLAVGLDRPDVVLIDCSSPAYKFNEVVPVLATSPDTRNINIVLMTQGMTRQAETEARKKWNVNDIVDLRAGAQELLQVVRQMIGLE